MEEYTQDNTAVLKRDKKDVLLTSKDPHLSHLFVHSGPQIPREILAQTTMEVDGNYAQGRNTHDYHLFEAQSGSFMTGLSPGSSSLMLDIEQTDTYGKVNAQNKHATRDENNNAHIDVQKKTINSSTRRLNESSKQHSPNPLHPPVVIQGALPQVKHVNGDEKHSHPQAIPSPADHYNMQLLAQSAQHQQLLQRQEQRHQESFLHGSSSVTRQNLVRLHQQEELHEVRLPHTSKGSPFPLLMSGKDEGQPRPLLLPGQPGLLTLPVSASLAHFSKRSPYHIPSHYGTWTGSERGTPDFARSHARDLSFGSQDSPGLSIHSGELSKHLKTSLTTTEQKTVVIPSVAARKDAEPELKSPLDHPEQMEERRNRFFSNDASISVEGQQHNEDEDPLNERDKKAAAALGELLEQNEKAPVEDSRSIINVTGVPPYHAQNLIASQAIASAMPMRILQMQQEIARHTPPPAYDPIRFPEQFHHFLQGGPPLLVQAPSIIPIEANVKQEQNDPAASSRHVLTPSSRSQTRQSPILMTEDRSQCNNSFQNAVMHQHVRDSTAGAYASLPASLNAENDNSTAASKAPNSARPRRTSSTGGGRRKSDGSLTCGICGHSFRSTPALNGHMRVHSASDKKHIKEERQMRTASANFATKTPPVATSSIAVMPYVRTDQQATIPGTNSTQINSDRFVEISQSPQFSTVAPHQSIQNTHNGLLAIASAACFLKTEPARPEYIRSSILSQAYVMPSTILLQQPPEVNVLNSNLAENQVMVPDIAPAVDPQGVKYSQIYASPFPQGLQFGNINIVPSVTPTAERFVSDSPYVAEGNHQAIMSEVDRPNVTDPQQNFLNQHVAASIDKSNNMFMVAPVDSFQSQPIPNEVTETNSLSQLASIAVATANRDLPPPAGMNNEFQENYSQNHVHPTTREPADASAGGWMPNPLHAAPQQECMSQPDLFQPETSPIRSGHDPFILPVTVPVTQQQRQFDDNEHTNSHSHREPMVTWKDSVATEGHHALLSSYDDPLMQEAVDVANPSKILPNSMMGGTPSVGTMFSGARPFRQRHHSEGAHLIRSSDTSILKQILDSPVPTVKLKETNSSSNSLNDRDVQQSSQRYGAEAANFNKKLEKPKEQTEVQQPEEGKVKEFWAEPKPIQRRVRRRRHSADSRLLLKSGSLINNRQHMLGIPHKKSGLLGSEVRVRHRPPPLVIPSSVSTFAPSHPAFYQSNLHHIRRPSGESSSSHTGISDKIPPYTPPPMLSPRRSGSGLFCATPVTPMFNRQKSIDAVIPTIPEEDENLEDEELVRSTEPKINIGTRFQASIPKMCSKDAVLQCEHKVDRVWISEPVQKESGAFKHIEQFMELSCSAAVPFGGSNKEYALDCIVQTKGDILAAVKRLIERKPGNLSALTNDKKYTGCGKKWTPEEAKLFDCAMIDHRKDFFVISKMVKTKTTSECVERYYHVTKRHRRRIRVPRRFRDQENRDIMSVLSSSPKKFKVESLTSASSSEEDQTDKEFSPAVNFRKSADLRNQKYGYTSPQRQTPVHSYHPQQQQHGDLQPKPVKPGAVRTQHGQQTSSSAMSSSSSVHQPTQVFTCPVCGKTFAKVKSRNAHMKTHGKQAQEKRRQREEEAARRRQPVPAQQLGVPPVHQPNFVRPAPVSSKQLFQSAVVQPHGVIPRYGSSP